MNLKELLNDHQTGMSEFQDDYFVTIKAGGTVYGCYKQALRELYKRFRGLRETTCDRDILKIEINQLDKSDGEELKDKVELRRKKMQIEECDRGIKDTQREFVRFYQQAIYLKEKVGELTDEKRKKLDMEMWEYKIKEMAVIDYSSTGHLSENTMRFTKCCPKEMRLKLFQELDPKNIQLLNEWYHNHEEIIIPKDLPEVKYTPKLIEMI